MQRWTFGCARVTLGENRQKIDRFSPRVSDETPPRMSPSWPPAVASAELMTRPAVAQARLGPCWHTDPPRSAKARANRESRCTYLAEPADTRTRLSSPENSVAGVQRSRAESKCSRYVSPGDSRASWPVV